MCVAQTLATISPPVGKHLILIQVYPTTCIGVVVDGRTRVRIVKAEHKAVHVVANFVFVVCTLTGRIE